MQSDIDKLILRLRITYSYCLYSFRPLDTLTEIDARQEVAQLYRGHRFSGFGLLVEQNMKIYSQKLEP